MAVQPNLMVRTSRSSARIHDPKHCSRQKSSISNGAFCNTLFYLGFAVVLTSILVILIVFCIASSPCNPSFSVSVAVAHFNFSSSRPSASWDLNIAAGNPNKYNGIDYRQIEAYVVYDGEVLAKTNLVPFYHQKLNTTIISTHLAMQPGHAAKPMAANRSTGEVLFDVWISAVVQFKTFHNVQRRRFLWFQCNSIRVNWREGSGKRSSSLPTKCDSEPLNW